MDMKRTEMGICKGCQAEFKKKMPHQAFCGQRCAAAKRYRDLPKDKKRELQKKKEARNMKKIKCREAAKYRFQNPEPCESCGQSATDRHHDNYNKPLEIRWLCAPCHREWHKINKTVDIAKDGQQILLPI